MEILSKMVEYPHDPWRYEDPGPYPHDERGNPVPGKEPPKNPDCGPCQEGIPLKWASGKWVHLDFFATYEAGALWDCPTPYSEEEDEGTDESEE